MEKLVLEYLGDDFLGCPVYKTEDGDLIKDANCDMCGMNLCTVSGDDVDGDPNIHISKIKKYQGLEVVILGRNNEPTREEKGNYMMLGRLKSDCDYFLSNGYEGHLWAGNVKSQIAEMKRLHSLFSNEKKPEWLSYEDIINYEKQMVA